VDIREIGVGENLAGVGRHLAGGVTDVGSESGQNDRSRGKPGASRAALALVAVALVAAVLDEQALAVVVIGCKSQRPKNQNQRGGEVNLVHVCRGYHSRSGAGRPVSMALFTTVSSVIS
jgi:hypothetical protein